MDYGVITFTSTYGAIYAQKVLRPVEDLLSIPAVRAALAASTLRPDEYAFYGVTGSGAALRAEPLDG